MDIKEEKTTQETVNNNTSVANNFIQMDYERLMHILGEAPDIFSDTNEEDNKPEEIDKKKQMRSAFIRVSKRNIIHKDNTTLGLKEGDAVEFSEDLVLSIVEALVKTKKELKYYVIRHSHIDDETLEETNIHWHIVLDSCECSKMYWYKLKELFPYAQISSARSVKKCVRYLTHLYEVNKTETYDWSDIITNSPEKIKEYKKCTVPTGDNAINKMLDDIGTGKTSLADVTKVLSPSQYAKYKKKLLLAEEFYFKNESEKFYSQMKNEGRLVNVCWFYGETETGKTFLAEKLASERGLYYKTSTEKDAFSLYRLETQIILDELRPNIIPYAELLSLFNPFSGGRACMSSRYFNKVLAYDTIYITSPFDPKSFCEAYRLSSIDTTEQLLRRISTVVKFDMEYLYEMKYIDGEYVEVNRKSNPYSKKNQKGYQLESIFDKL